MFYVWCWMNTFAGSNANTFHIVVVFPNTLHPQFKPLIMYYFGRLFIEIHKIFAQVKSIQKS